MFPSLVPGATGVLALADGTVLQGHGVGATGEAVGEVCFNTAMSGYQEILTDPSSIEEEGRRSVTALPESLIAPPAHPRALTPRPQAPTYRAVCPPGWKRSRPCPNRCCLG